MATVIEGEKRVPRSVLRHRPIGGDGQKVERSGIRASRPGVSRVTRKIELDEPIGVKTGDTGAQESRTETVPMFTRLDGVAEKGGSGKEEGQRQSGVKAAKNVMRAKSQWYTSPVMVALICLMGIWSCQSLIGWGSTLYDDLRYGRPRTNHVDSFVGHESGKTPSHFIAINWHGQAQIIEYPGGDASKAKIYLGPRLAGSDAELATVTIRFVSGRDSQHPDMIMEVRGIQTIFRNENGGFRLE